MQIAPFKVEEWMNAYEHEAVYNIAETCVDSLTVEELIKLDGTDPVDFFQNVAKQKLTYGHIIGSPEFRQRIANLYESVTDDQVLIMNGAIGANFLVLYTLVQPGDHVIAVHPTYQQLYDVPRSFGASVDLLRLRKENNYLPDLAELRSLVRDNTKLIIINNPNNPTGSLMDEAYLKEIVAIARESDAYLLCDEVYRNLLQTDQQIPSIVDLYEKGISTSSMSKVLSLAGLRLGWIAAPQHVIHACLQRRDYNTISCGVIDDMLAVHALRNYDKILARNLKIVRDNLAILDAWVATEPNIHYVKPQAGTTALLHYDYPLSSEELCLRLFQANGAFLTPGSCFDLEGTLRIGYACATDVLEDGLEHVSAFLRTLE